MDVQQPRAPLRDRRPVIAVVGVRATDVMLLGRLAGLPARVVTVPHAALDVGLHGLTLVICDALDVGEVRAGTIQLAFQRAPLLALGPDDELADAAAQGADFVATDDAWHPEATLASAVRLAKERRLAQDFTAALNAVSDAVEILGANSELLWTNHAFTLMSGYPAEEVAGRDAFALLQSPVHAPALYDHLRDQVRAGEAWRGSLVALRKDGHAVEQLVTTTPRRTPEGTVDGAITVAQFLAPALRRADDDQVSSIAALAESEQRFRVMMEAAADAILIFDFDNAHAIDVNPATCSLFGYTRAAFLKLTGAILGGPDAAEHVARMSASLKAMGNGHEPRHPMTRADGSKFFADVRITIYEFRGRKQYLVIVRDVTDAVQRERDLLNANADLAATKERLLHSDRLASLGQLAASVAHEINNPLQYMLSSLASLRAGQHTTEQLDILGEGIQRIRSITRALLPFSRADAVRRELVPVAEVVETVRRMTATEVSARARFEVHVEPGLIVSGDRTQLAQLLTNLITNAAQSLDNTAPDAQQRNRIRITATRDGDAVLIAVADTGRGIPEAVRSRIFQPFFTTKSREAGTGLGLSLCLDLAQQHGGDLTFTSDVGVGTTFLLSLPAAETAPAEVVVPAVAPVTSQPARILAIDDEALVAACYPLLLPDCEVEIAIGAEEALEILEGRRSFDLIVSDLMMPGLDGPALYEQIAARWPGLEQRVVFCSGGAFTTRSQEFLARIGARPLAKPVATADLTAAIAETLRTLGPAPS